METKRNDYLFYIENGKTQGNAFIETSEQSIEKKSARMPSFPLLTHTKQLSRCCVIKDCIIALIVSLETTEFASRIKS